MGKTFVCMCGWTCVHLVTSLSITHKTVVDVHMPSAPWRKLLVDHIGNTIFLAALAFDDLGTTVTGLDNAVTTHTHTHTHTHDTDEHT